MGTFKMVIIVLSLVTLNHGQTELNQNTTTKNGNNPSTILMVDNNSTSLSSCNHIMTSNYSGVVSKHTALSTSKNESCELFLRAPVGYHIRLFFLKLKLHVSPGCFTSRIDIYRGSHHDRYCGFHLPFYMLTETNGVLIKFETDHLNVSFANTFEIKYSYYNVSFTRLNDRSVEIFSTYGSLTNNPYNAIYRLEHINIYSWKIQVNVDRLIQLKWAFHNIRVEMYLEIIEGPSRSINSTIICQGTAQNIPISIFGSCSNLSNLKQHGEILSSTNMLNILFSDLLDANETIHLNYTTKSISESTDRHHICGETKIKLNNQWPYILQKSINSTVQCVIKFETEKNYGILIDFSKIYFDGFNHGRCEYGGIMLQDKERQIGPVCSTTARKSGGYIPNLTTFVSSSNVLNLVIYCRNGCFNLLISAMIHKTVCRTIYNKSFKQLVIPSIEQPCGIFDFTLKGTNFSHSFLTELDSLPKVSTKLSSCTITKEVSSIDQLKNRNIRSVSSECPQPFPVLSIFKVTCLWSPALISFKSYDLNLDPCPLIRRSGYFHNPCGVFISPQLFATDTQWQYVELGLGLVNSDFQVDCKDQNIDRRCDNQLSMPYYFSIEFIAQSKYGCRFIDVSVTETVRIDEVTRVCKDGRISWSAGDKPITSTMKVISMCEKPTTANLPFPAVENIVAGKVVTMAAHDVLVRLRYQPFSVPFAMVSYRKHIRNVTEQSQSSNCPEGFIFHEGFCYFLNSHDSYTTEISWSDAERECNTRNATLLSIATKKEANDIRDLIAGKWLRQIYVSEHAVILIGLGNFIQVI